MNSILHFRKVLQAPPVVARCGDVHVRTLAIPQDLAGWLAARERATAELEPKARAWSLAEFFTEMVHKPWWSSDRSWVAVPANNSEAIVGAVTMAIRAGKSESVPVVHWLLVDPEWRRRGVGRLLLLHLERGAWEEGWREVQLETHAGWRAATAFYHSMGYSLLRVAPPR